MRQCRDKFEIVLYKMAAIQIETEFEIQYSSRTNESIHYSYKFHVRYLWINVASVIDQVKVADIEIVIDMEYFHFQHATFIVFQTSLSPSKRPSFCFLTPKITSLWYPSILFYASHFHWARAIEKCDFYTFDMPLGSQKTLWHTLNLFST